MTPDQYVEAILSKYAVSTGPQSQPERAANTVAPTIRQWAGSSLASLTFSGSYAKGTPVHGGTDVDLFISLNASTPQTLGEIYDSLLSLASRNFWLPRKQDVSVGITVNNLFVDLVPGKIQLGYQNYHSLYRSKSKTWTQTNVAVHISTIKNSQRTKEIRAIKIWRNLQQLDFPSFYLELIVLEALKGRTSYALADNVLHALRYIGASLTTTRIMDPANTNNTISDDLTLSEKQAIASQARMSANSANWEQIIW